MAGILNPPVQASVCREMIEQVDGELARAEASLTLTLLSQEQYLQAFGKAAALRAVSKTLRTIYDRNFNV